jgi:hypothetical protein
MKRKELRLAGLDKIIEEGGISNIELGITEQT